MISFETLCFTAVDWCHKFIDYYCVIESCVPYGHFLLANSYLSTCKTQEKKVKNVAARTIPAREVFLLVLPRKTTRTSCFEKQPREDENTACSYVYLGTSVHCLRELMEFVFSVDHHRIPNRISSKKTLLSCQLQDHY